MLSYNIQANGPLNGACKIPGDKSMSHRAVMLSALATGTSEITGFLPGLDCLATVNAMQAMGAEVEILGPGHLQLTGVGLNGLKPVHMPLNLGNSDTSMRLLTGILAGQNFSTELTGDQSLNKRPMQRIIEPLGTMGAKITSTENFTAPLVIHGHPLTAIDYQLPIASAQVKSALLLAAMYANGVSRVIDTGNTRDHTERMLRSFSYPINQDSNAITVEGGYELKAAKVDIPGDFSSAIFFIVAAVLVPGSSIKLSNIGVNPTRMGALEILKQMGAKIAVTNQRDWGHEPVADIEVHHSTLTGIDVPKALIPRAIDDLPALAIAAAQAEGTTFISGAHELRYKESDRLTSIAKGLAAIGVKVAEQQDGLKITGGPIAGGSVTSFKDHRIAMAFAIAGLLSDNPVHIDDACNVATSFPHFAKVAATIGWQIQELYHA